MARAEYYDDPSAPAATTLVCAVSVVVVEDGRLLLIRRADSGQWALPGGGHEPGESARQAAVRETREETGIDVAVDGIVGVYSDPGHVMVYDDGEVRQEYSVCLRARAVGGDPTPSEESLEVAWVPTVAVDALDMQPSMRRRIRDGVRGGEPHLD